MADVQSGSVFALYLGLGDDGTECYTAWRRTKVQLGPCPRNLIHTDLPNMPNMPQRA